MKKYGAGKVDIQFVPFESPDLDLAVILCGCRRACIDKDDIKSQARHNIVITGENLQGTIQDESRLLEHIIHEIERLSGFGD